jgi:hypothetical protein
MRHELPSPMLFVLILLLPPFGAVSTRQSSSSEDKQAAVPRDSIPQYLPCTDQPKSFTELLGSFAAGRLPLPSDVTGSWALVGIWVHKDSRPDLNCSGVKRGRQFEWILIAQGYSIEVNAIGTKRQTTNFKADDNGNLTFSIELDGDYVPTFRCRLTRRHTLACLGSPYYDAVEFKKISVNTELTRQ